MVMPRFASSLRADRDRHGTQRQSAHVCYCNEPLWNRSGRVPAIDPRLRSTVYREALGPTRSAIASDAAAETRSAAMRRRIAVNIAKLPELFKAHDTTYAASAV